MSQKYFDQQADMTRRAREVLGMLQNRPDHPFFEGVEGIENVKSVWRSAYEKSGWPSNMNMLASAHAALERMIQRHTAMLEDTPTTFISGGVMKVPAWGMFILPVMLQSTTNAMCTYVDAPHDIVDILSLIPVSEEGRGDYQEGERLDGTNMGRLSSMRRYVTLPVAAQPDGTKTTFKFDIHHDIGIPAAIPVAIRAGTVRLIVNGGSFPVDFDNEFNRSTKLNVAGLGATTATIDYEKGLVTIDFDKTAQFAPLIAQGTTLNLECDIDEELSPAVIGSITVAELMQRVRTTRYVLSAQYTIQAMYDLQREQNLTMNDLLVAQITKFIASEKDSRRMRTALAHVVRKNDIDCDMPAGMDLEEWVYGIKKQILAQSDGLKVINNNLGFTAAYCGEKAGLLFRSLPVDYFVADPSYQLSTGLCRAGRLFDLIDIFVIDTPSVAVFQKVYPAFKETSALFVCSDGNGHSPLITGDGIAPVQIDHEVTPVLTKRVTLYGTEVNAVNPFQGPDYMLLAELKNIK